MYYFSLKASEELKQFSNLGIYANITKDIDGVLYYSGRILENYKFDGYPGLCEAAIDLCRTSFCVPVIASVLSCGNCYCSGDSLVPP